MMKSWILALLHPSFLTATAGASLLLSGCAPAVSVTPSLLPPKAFEIAPDGVWTWFNDERAIILSNGATARSP
jgi:hypothetical protein